MVAPQHLPAGVTYCKCNVADFDSVDAATRGADAAVHLASVIDLRSSAHHQARMRNINIVGTHNVINACVANGLAALVYTGSTAARFQGVQPREPHADVEDEEGQNRIFLSELTCSVRACRTADCIFLATAVPPPDPSTFLYGYTKHIAEKVSVFLFCARADADGCMRRLCWPPTGAVACVQLL